MAYLTLGVRRRQALFAAGGGGHHLTEPVNPGAAQRVADALEKAADT